MDHVESVRALLRRGPMSSRQLVENLGISQPTVSRAIAGLGDEVIRFGEYRSIHYALHRPMFGEPRIPVYRITPEGKIRPLGTLIPVHPTGFVMHESEGRSLHSEGLPWWLYDMRPQGFLGRAYAARHAADLGLPPRLGDWKDEHVLLALISHGHDAVGNLLLGEAAKGRFLAQALPQPIPGEQGVAEYARLAASAAKGDVPGSSAGGEQPKFAAYAETDGGSQHVLVKFSLPALPGVPNPIAERWRDLLLAEHLALDVLRDYGIAAAQTRILDHEEQRFLEIVRFDRIGPLGRRGLFSLAALDAEFVGQGRGNWAALTEPLARAGHIEPEAHETTCFLYAFGTLIGNTDMHSGNLSFITENGRPYQLAPAYDMLPMAFAPRTSGELPSSLNPVRIDGRIRNAHWLQAFELARRYLGALREAASFSDGFAPCIDALEQHLEIAGEQISRLG